MAPLNVAILGQGRSGRDIHGHFMLQDPERFRVAAVVEPLEERRRRAEQEYGCPAFDSYHALLDRRGIDLVVNAAPSHLHVPITLDLLEHGFDVLCEKPLAKRAGEVDALIAASQSAGRLLAIFQQSRFAPYFLKVREVIGSGVLGRIVQISIAFSGFGRRWDWQTLQEYNGGSLLNTGPHPLDQALRLLNIDVNEVPTVRCWMDRAATLGDAEDFVKLILSAPDRPLVDLEISSSDAYPGFTYKVQGTHGSLKATTSHAEWKYTLTDEAPAQRLTREPLFTAERTPAYCSETLTWHEASWDLPAGTPLFDRMSRAFYDMLYDAVTRGAPLEVTPQQVRQQIAVIEECHRQNPQIYAPVVYPV